MISAAARASKVEVTALRVDARMKHITTKSHQHYTDTSLKLAIHRRNGFEYPQNDVESSHDNEGW